MLRRAAAADLDRHGVAGLEARDHAAEVVGGETVLTGGRLNFPCRYLEKLLGRPVYTPLLNRSGLNCRIEVGGLIRKGDPITPLED